MSLGCYFERTRETRSFGEDAAPPGETASALRAKYDRLKAKAKREHLGASGEGAASPTLELTEGGEEEKPNDSKLKFDPDTGIVDITDLIPSSVDVLSTPVE